jgi:hypothetical protein
MNKIRHKTWAATMLLALCFCAGANRLQAQSVYEPYTFTTLAGGGGRGSADGTGSAARFSQPSGVVTDASGNVYVADTRNCTIRKITPAGVVSTLAGLAGAYGSADGTGSAARFSQPTGVATDATGNVYVADTGNNGIRKGFIPPPRLAAYATANGWFVFQISGSTNHACRIETSTNLNSLANWLPIYTNTAPFWYTNVDIGADPQRFYRATIRQ